MTYKTGKNIITRRGIAPGCKLLAALMAVMGGLNILLALFIIVPDDVYTFVAVPAFVLVATAIILLFVQVTVVQIDDLGFTHTLRPFLPYWSLYERVNKHRYTWDNIRAYRLGTGQKYSKSYSYLRLFMQDGRQIEIQQGDDVNAFKVFTDTVIHLMEKHAKHATRLGSHQTPGKVKALYNYSQAYIPTPEEKRHQETGLYQSGWVRVILLAIVGLTLAMFIITVAFYLEGTGTGFATAGRMLKLMVVMVPGTAYLLFRGFGRA